MLWSPGKWRTSRLNQDTHDLTPLLLWMLWSPGKWRTKNRLRFSHDLL
jgi:hypothetical protein